MSSLTSCLAAFLAILIAGAAVYQGRMTERTVAISLEVLREEIRGLRRVQTQPLPTAPDALPLPPAPDPAPGEPLREATPAEPLREAEALAELDGRRANGPEEDRRHPAGPRYDEAPPRLSQAQLERVQERRRQRDEKRRERRFARLESPQAETRARSVFGLDPSDARGAEALADALDDPDPRVRVEATSRLQFGEPRVALPLLVQALADPESAVVVEAIDSLKFLRDPAAIPDLEPLLDHPDPDVQREARAAVNRLR
jgi:hypothetical protein